jgi:hypothetical protein
MGRCKNGEIISERGRSPSARKRKLRRLIRAALKRNALDVWRRGRGVLSYIEGRRVIEIAGELEVARGSVNRWLQWYESMGVPGLLTGKPPGAAPKLNETQRAQLSALIEEKDRALRGTPAVCGPVRSSAI